MKEIIVGKDYIKEIKKLGFLFRSLMLHSDGIWTAKAVTGKYKEHINFIEVIGNTPEEAIQKLIEKLQIKNLLSDE